MTSIQNHFLIARVTDKGPGIPSEEREKVFNKFYRGGRVTNAEGTGLGLAVVKKLLEGINGNIKSLAPSNGKGACFEIQCPLSLVTKS